MGSKERIIKQKEDVRNKIIAAAWRIVKKEGWQAMSMRKIADSIDYTAPIIYGYFDNKDALLVELTRQGFLKLADRLRQAKAKHKLPAKQLEAMWFTYWDFAFDEPQYYKLMFGVDVNCYCEMGQCMETEMPSDIFSEVIEELVASSNNPNTDVCKKYYLFWSVIHGLISINMVNKGKSDKLNQEILKDAITGIIRTIVV
ncbi:MAG TPA: TetR/AcrR family transcriptional regulator [Flavipsychrobacter sp.]|nr:TetR/AcrR family transcriptional regulator [Flavipsychrobacter sp.]